MGILENMGLEPNDAATDSAIESKCQENEWICRGGIPWQDDPYLEEYPYEFCHAPSMEALARFFEHGNWAIRQGITYGDLAFVQQVDGGDEWWGLKRDGEGWRDFESANLGTLLESSRQDFERTIASMSAATAEECANLEYRLPYGAASKAAQVLAAHDAEGVMTTPEELKRETAETIANSSRSSKRITEELEDAGTDASRSLLQKLRVEIAKSKEEPLEDRSAAARESSRVYNEARPGAIRQATAR